GSGLAVPNPTMNRLSELNFWTGFALFRDPWVAAPSSTSARDGLGPLFSARSCIACHEDVGRGDSLIHNQQTLATVYRVLSNGRLQEDYGTHLQSRATFDLQKSGRRVIGFYAGEPQPDVVIRRLPVPNATRSLSLIDATVDGEIVSPRVAPAMVGLGLLERVPERRLQSLEDPDDRDDDGVSGRINWIDFEGVRMPGRFGWKASQPSIAVQAADAFRNDIGITSALKPEQNCAKQQTECARQADGAGPRGPHEINDPLFQHVVYFSASLAVPSARPLTAERRRGADLFSRLECDSCHTPSHVVATEFGDEQTIWPYTDLLLHDMGPLLADGVVESSATGSEWRTPPLWSLGVALELNPEAGLLHDGRAATVAEAVIWHGGEATESAAEFLKLSESEQDALEAFVLAL
ncbi:MAG: di-heme oxidoredictase family protein, partial [Pseudomonadota bacterium]